ncbi:MAG: ATP-dependent helicase HrpB, partial [Gemmatimonadota bacterium]
MSESAAPVLDRLPDLPVRAVLPELEEALAEARCAVLTAPPGAGKTTLAPLALLSAAWLQGRKVLVLEPRRLATRAAAYRMAELVGEPGAGGTVGYRVRFDTRVSARTRVEVVTEGVLTRMLQADPALSDVGAVLFDEFHERSLHADLGLALTLQSRALLRDDLRVLVMSATLDADPVARLLGGDGEPAPVVESRGRMYPVETRYRDRPVDGWIEPPVADTVLRALDEAPGDVLVFLPGAGEIRRTAERLEEAGLPAGISLHPLFGALTREEQDRAIRPSPPGRRKVVLATSIAETSLTIEGVRVVVDAGLMRVPRFDPGTGMTRLETVRVTRDAADQRRGRAGRLESGVCYRLWTEGEDQGLVPARRPEILEADLAPLALELAAWGARPEELQWLDPPPEAAFAQARELLRELEALDEHGAITDHGRALAGVGAHPRLAHLLLRGRALGYGGLAADLAALLNNRDILRASGRAADADLRLRVEALQGARKRGGRPGSVGIRGHDIHRGGLRQVLREADHWRRHGDGDGGAHGPGYTAVTGLLLSLAYPDRVGQRRPGERGRFLLRNGRGAAFREVQTLGDADWIVAAELDGRGREGRIFRAAPVTLEEIEAVFAVQIREADAVEWDPEAGRVRAFRRRRLGALVLSEAPLSDPPAEALADALVEGIREVGLGALPWSRETRQLRDRIGFLHHLEPEDWPDTSDQALTDGLETWLGPFLGGMRSLDDLRRLDLAQPLLTAVGWDRRDELDRMAPTHQEVPSGSRIRLDYSNPEAPVLAVRLQELFGLTETPRVGDGRVPLTLHLLSPAR